MDTLYAKIAVLLNLLGLLMIRWPHGNRISVLKIDDDRKNGREIALLAIAGIGTTLIPVIWLVSPLFDYAEYPLHPGAYWPGLAITLFGLWLFHRSHAGLGLLWSVTLQLREEHKLVTTGIYSRVRHPMYSALLALGIAMALTLPNWFAGPAYLTSFCILYLLRISNEEQMMRDRFGGDYDAYCQRTGRLIPKW